MISSSGQIIDDEQLLFWLRVCLFFCCSWKRLAWGAQSECNVLRMKMFWLWKWVADEKLSHIQSVTRPSECDKLLSNEIFGYKQEAFIGHPERTQHEQHVTTMCWAGQLCFCASRRFSYFFNTARFAILVLTSRTRPEILQREYQN